MPGNCTGVIAWKMSEKDELGFLVMPVVKKYVQK